MAFEAEFLEMMDQVVGFVMCLGFDRNGDPIYETDEEGDEIVRNYRCRISGKSLSLRQPTENEETPIFDIHVGMRLLEDGTLRPVGSDPFNELMKVILPVGDPVWATGTPIIFATGRYPDDNSYHHVKVQLGWRYHRQGQ